MAPEQHYLKFLGDSEQIVFTQFYNSDFAIFRMNFHLVIIIIIKVPIVVKSFYTLKRKL